MTEEERKLAVSNKLTRLLKEGKLNEYEKQVKYENKRNKTFTETFLDGGKFDPSLIPLEK